MAPVWQARQEHLIPTRLWLAPLGLAFVVYGVTGGCGAQRLPPRLTRQESTLLGAAPLPYSVLVVPAARRFQNPQAYAKGAYQWLQRSGAFRDVRLAATERDSADLVAMSTGAYCNTAAIPLLTGLTLGLFPTVFTDVDCEGVVLRRFGATVPDHHWMRVARPGSTDSVVVTDTASGRVVMGWAAVVVGWLPGWTHGEAQAHPRARDRRRLAFVRRQEALAALPPH